MFNLEQSISNWRHQMLAAGIEFPVPLEELELHLREEIERQMKLGLDEQNAFNSAIRQFGKSPDLKREFSKVEGQSIFCKPLNLKLLAAWYVFMGLNSLAVMPYFFFRRFWIGDLACDFFVILFSSQILIGLGLLRRQNFWRIAALIWPAIALFCFIHPQVFLHSYHAHNGGNGLTNWSYLFFGLPFPRIIIQVLHVFNLVVLFFGYFVLFKGSTRKLFLPASTI